MSIRTKLLVALLIAVFFPLGYALILGVQSTVQLGRVVARNQRALLLDDAEGVLLAMVRKNVELFEQEASIFFTAIALQAREAEIALARPVPEGGTVFTAEAFLEGGTAPGLSPSRQHLVHRSDSGPHPALVSFAEPAVYLADESSRDDGARLASLKPLLRSLRPTMTRSAYWQFVTLESGAHLVYPGHALLPVDYDARQSPAYQRAMARRDGGGGSPPSIDPATGATLVGVTRPIHDADGEVIGQTGLMARVDSMVQGFDVGTDWGQDAETYFLSVEPDLQGVLRLFIVAKRSYAESADGATGFVEVEEFTTDDAADAQAVTEALQTGAFGSRVVSIEGERMLCCFGGTSGDSIGLLTLVPVASAAGIADTAEAYIRQRSIAQLVGILVGVLVFGVAMSWAAIVGARAITHPIRSLMLSIKRVAEGDFDVRAEVMSADEIGVLAEAFNRMVPQLEDQMRMRQSLDLAQQVQRGLLPAAPPNVPGFDVAGVSLYCDETGGDYFDFVDFDQPSPGRLTIAVGDVTGHGVAAALLMATARALIRMRAALPGALGEHIADINRHLAHDADTGRFMTLMLLSLDRETLSARWVGAGHDPVLVYDPSDGSFTELAGADIPLGLEGDWTFSELSSDALREGQVLVIGTDGIWETLNEGDEQFGKARLRECIRAHAAGSADDIARAIIGEIEAFRGSCAQLDDVTMVVLKITPM